MEIYICMLAMLIVIVIQTLVTNAKIEDLEQFVQKCLDEIYEIKRGN